MPVELPSERRYAMTLFSRANYKIRKLKSSIDKFVTFAASFFFYLLYLFSPVKCFWSRDIKEYPSCVRGVKKKYIS